VKESDGMQGTVMKKTDNIIVILCDDGKFRNIPLPEKVPNLGERITIPETHLYPNKKKKIIMPKSWMAAAIIIGLITMSMLLFIEKYTNESIAMVAIDINPSFELYVNSNGKVTNVIYKNEDAIKLMNKQELKNKGIYDALNLVISEAEQKGYLESEFNKRMIMVSVLDLKQSSYIVDVAKLENKQPYNIQVNYINKEIKEKADALGLSVNKYLIYQESESKGLTLNVEEIRERSIDDLYLQTRKDTENDMEKSEDPPKEKEGNSESNRKEARKEKDLINKYKNEDEDEDNEEDDDVEDEGGDKDKDKDDNNAEDKDDESYNGIREIKVKVEFFEENKLKLEYKNVEGKVKAEVEKRTKEGTEKYKGEQAKQTIENLLDKIALTEDMHRAEIFGVILAVLEIKEGDFKELEIEIKFTNNKQIEIEFENEVGDKDEDEDENDDDQDEDDDE
jgi:hypothetical protein